jgi:hypothetical protein
MTRPPKASGAGAARRVAAARAAAAIGAWVAAVA